jgi:hypothetical protein
VKYVTISKDSNLNYLKIITNQEILKKMALTNGTNLTYLNINKDKPAFYNKKLGIEGTRIEGHFVKLVRKDGEFEGNPTIQYHAWLEDRSEGKTYSVQLNGETFLGLCFFKAMRNVNPERSVCFSIYKNKAGKTYMGIFQNDKQVPQDESFPQPTTVTVGTKKVTDWTEVIKAIDVFAAGFNPAKEVVSTEITVTDEPEVQGTEVDNTLEDNIPF